MILLISYITYDKVIWHFNGHTERRLHFISLTYPLGIRDFDSKPLRWVLNPDPIINIFCRMCVVKYITSLVHE